MGQVGMRGNTRGLGCIPLGALNRQGLGHLHSSIKNIRNGIMYAAQHYVEAAGCLSRTWQFHEALIRNVQAVKVSLYTQFRVIKPTEQPLSGPLLQIKPASALQFRRSSKQKSLEMAGYSTQGVVRSHGGARPPGWA